MSVWAKETPQQRGGRKWTWACGLWPISVGPEGGPGSQGRGPLLQLRGLGRLGPHLTPHISNSKHTHSAPRLPRTPHSQQIMARPFFFRFLRFPLYCARPLCSHSSLLASPCLGHAPSHPPPSSHPPHPTCGLPTPTSVLETLSSCSLSPGFPLRHVLTCLSSLRLSIAGYPLSIRPIPSSRK